MQAVVNQTISGLACGKPIKGNVMFLGGPLNYLDMLRDRFIKTLDLKENEIIIPEDARVFVCLGACLENNDSRTFTVDEIKSLISSYGISNELSMIFLYIFAN
jgi:activator of 2-hydroxyglutaryl-CoA dehydratase